MADQQGYLSIAAPAQAELVEKKSRFIGQICPVESEAAAQAFLEQVRAQFRDANHHVYAMQIGAMNEIQRSNDAGEPAGTAGRPVLEAIKKAELQNVVCVVTRYFGGILLGSGGLTRAYGKTAQLAVQAAQRVRILPAQICSLSFDYGLLGKIESFVAERRFQIVDKSYGQDVCFLLALPLNELAGLHQTLLDLSAGTLRLQELGEQTQIAQPLV